MNLQELGVAVLDVVHVQHHVVAHLEGQVQPVQFFAGGGVGGLGRVQRCDPMADRRAVDLHENQAQPVGDVLHQRGLAVAGRRDDQQQAHAIGPLLLAGHADLFGQVVADQRQIDFVDQLVADERGQHAGAEFIEFHIVPSRVDQFLLSPDKAAIQRHDAALELVQLEHETVVVQVIPAAARQRVTAG